MLVSRHTRVERGRERAIRSMKVREEHTFLGAAAALALGAALTILYEALI
jgi:hypothetical protein